MKGVKKIIIFILTAILILNIFNIVPVFALNNEGQKIDIPVFGEVHPRTPRLALSAMFGVADGFNICSLAALTLILSLVFTLKSRKKALFLGGIFILTTAIVYGFLIILWHKLFLILAPYIGVMNILLAVLSLIGGLFFLRQFFNSLRQRGLVCNLVEGTFFGKISQKMGDFFQKKNSLLSLAVIVFLFAAVVVIVEFPCSAIIPMIFAGILADAGVPFVTFLFPYLTVFLLFYMIDETIIFLISVYTMKIWTTSPKISKALNLIIALLLFYVAFYFFSKL